jgi:hypothetical protein
MPDTRSWPSHEAKPVDLIQMRQGSGAGHRIDSQCVHVDGRRDGQQLAADNGADWHAAAHRIAQRRRIQDHTSRIATLGLTWQANGPGGG